MLDEIKFYLIFNKIKEMYSPFLISVVLLGYFIVFGDNRNQAREGVLGTRLGRFSGCLIENPIQTLIIRRHIK